MKLLKSNLKLMNKMIPIKPVTCKFIGNNKKMNNIMFNKKITYMIQKNIKYAAINKYYYNTQNTIPMKENNKQKDPIHNPDSMKDSNENLIINGSDIYICGIILVGIVSGLYVLGGGIYAIINAKNSDKASKILLILPFVVFTGFVIGIILGLVWPISVPLIIIKSFEN